MKKFNITVNGKIYEVEVETIGEEAANISPPKRDYTAPAPKAAPVPKSKPKPEPVPTTAGGNVVNAPMPGTIFDIKVNVGDTVNSGDVLLILEAMKMENEIVAHKDGKVASINVSKGASVNSGDVLVTLE